MMEPPAPTRNVFEYAGRPETPPDPISVGPASLSPVSPPHEPEPPVRLVGLLRRGGRLRAALSLGGEVVIVGHGERAGQYSVLSIDDDRGVRLSGPDGELTLPPPEAP